MITKKAPVGAVVIDSLQFSQSGTQAQATALRASGVDAVAVYLGAINSARVGFLHNVGLGVIPVTFGGEYNDGSSDEIAQLKALGMPIGIHVFLDMEGLAAFHADPRVIIQKVKDWAVPLKAAGWIPALYAGVPQPLTSDELWHLPVEAYWKGQGRQVDRNGALAEPTGCGWCMTQMFPSVQRGGVLVDCNMVGSDFKGRTPIWAASSVAWQSNTSGAV